jgi:hypothetical protein
MIFYCESGITTCDSSILHVCEEREKERKVERTGRRELEGSLCLSSPSLSLSLFLQFLSLPPVLSLYFSLSLTYSSPEYSSNTQCMLGMGMREKENERSNEKEKQSREHEGVCPVLFHLSIYLLFIISAVISGNTILVIAFTFIFLVNSIAVLCRLRCIHE